jgi:TetR/AcrR family transcriptional regulator
MKSQKLAINDRRKRVIQERRERERAQRIESILEAAKKVFFPKGYVKATMDEIALEAEISKPTIYQYFKSKDDLFFSLMLPVVEDIGTELEKIENKLTKNRYKDGACLIRDLFEGLLRTYERAPVTFRIVQLFQQTGLVQELNEEIQSALNSRGSRNFEIARRIAKLAMRQGLLRDTNVYWFVDVLWGLFVGIVQLEDIKSQHRQENRFLKPVLKLAQRMMTNAMSSNKHVRRNSNAI